MSFLKYPDSYRRGVLLLLTFVGLIAPGWIIAAQVTVTASGPITSMYGPTDELFGPVDFGMPISISFTYDDSSLAVYSPGPNTRQYFGSATTSASFGDYSFQGPTNLLMTINLALRTRILGVDVFGDWVGFSLNGGGNSSHGQMIFPVGTLSETAFIPEVAPSWISLSQTGITPEEVLGIVRWDGEVGPGIAIPPAPEPATYGLFASLVLVGVAAVRRRKALQMTERRA